MLYLLIIAVSISKSTSLIGPCMIDDSRIISGTTYHISSCLFCQCDKNTQQVSCYKKEFSGAVHRLCEDCRSLPTNVSCSYCEKPNNASVLIPVGNPIEIENAPGCISCNCSLIGDVSCFYYNHTLCDNRQSCRFALTDKNMDRLSCSNGCIDPSSGFMRPEGTWETKEGIKCTCLKSLASCFHMKELGGYMFVTGCLPTQCTPEKYNALYVTGKDCEFNGQTVKHGTTSFAQVYNLKGCFQCTCYAGALQCESKGSWMEGSFPTFEFHAVVLQCSSVEKCEKEKSSPAIKKYCDANPIERQCKGSYVWDTDFCKLNCTKLGQKPTYELTRKTWCSALPELKKKDCDFSCPDRQLYMNMFGSSLVSCNSTDQMIWKDQICDGKQDCLNNDDEKDCENFFCRYSFDHNQVLWSSIAVEETQEISCDQIPYLKRNYSKYGLKGKMLRKCNWKSKMWTNETEWDNKIDCRCTIDGFPSFDTNVNLTYDSISNDMDRLYNHFNISPSNIQHYEKIVDLLNITLQKFQFDNSSEGNFVYQTTEWHEKNDLNLYNIFKRAAKMKTTGRFCDTDNQQMDTLYFKLHEEYNIPFFNYSLFKSSFVKALGAENKLIRKMLQMRKDNLMQRKEERIHQVPTIKTNIDKLEEILSAISIFCLAIGLLAFQFVRNKSMKLFIHKNLILSFLLNAICYKIPLWFVQNLRAKSKAGCFTVSVLSYFFTLSTFSWMMVEGINIIIIVVFVFKGNRNYHKQYLVIGYGLPLLITGVMVGIFYSKFQNAYQCTILTGDYLWTMRGPVTFYISVNVIFFILIIMKIRRLSVQRNSIRAKSQESKNNVSPKTFLVLVPLLGIPFIFAPFVEYSIYIAYTFVIMNGLTGFYLLVGHVILDSMVVDEIKKNLALRRNRSSNESSSQKSRQSSTKTSSS
ncbi:uncharacterized protein [Clytia hemisphaerica]|uniref:Uncharacterized protein n=1 Tax=Clytia hemisphaerica TaxID=252671 RepID=A0A7M5X7I0_9CNID